MQKKCDFFIFIQKWREKFKILKKFIGKIKCEKNGGKIQNAEKIDRKN